MNPAEKKAPHVGFIRRSGVFIILALLSSIFEVGFNAVSARLPDGGYSSFNAFFNIFFILVAPLTGIQFLVSKEVSSYASLNEYGKAKAFAQISFRYIVCFSLVALLIGSAASKFIAEFLNIESVLPVILLMITLAIYSPFPVLYGTIQGLKRFLMLGFVTFSRGFFRLLFAGLVLFVFSISLNRLMLGVIAAEIACIFLAWITLRSFLQQRSMSIDRQEIRKAYRLFPPIVITIFCVSVLKNADIVFARRFFNAELANAYTCAARVGSAFFILTSVIMVMFPHVSEEKTLSRNPIIFLLKSFLVTIGLSCIGILISWNAPGLVMKIITLGKTIPGSQPLIRVIGFAVIPVALVYIMSNYLLAKHKPGFLPILIGGMLLQILAITFMHQTPLRMLITIAIANTTTCVVMLVYIIWEHRQYMESSGDG